MADDINYESREYRSWRYACLARDNFTCQLTGSKTGLQVHHIVPWAKNERLRFVVSNGITLCKEAHDMVFGNEDKYESIFKDLVKKNSVNAYKRGGEMPKVRGKRRYKPKNSRSRF